MNVEKFSDELWVGVKGQPNPGIAGSPRNIFRYSLGKFVAGVEHWMGKGLYQVTDPTQTPNTVHINSGSQAVGDKLHCREGNNPDRQLRPLSAS
jgi:hypothetical protein